MAGTYHGQPVEVETLRKAASEALDLLNKPVITADEINRVGNQLAQALNGPEGDDLQQRMGRLQDKFNHELLYGAMIDILYEKGMLGEVLDDLEIEMSRERR